MDLLTHLGHYEDHLHGKELIIQKEQIFKNHSTLKGEER